jgi:hypothetical protein
LLMIVHADRYDWRSLDTAPVGEDVTLLVREGRGRRYGLPYPCRRTAAGWISGTGPSLRRRTKSQHWTAHVRARCATNIWTCARSKRCHGRRARPESGWSSVVRIAALFDPNGGLFLSWSLAPELRPNKTRCLFIRLSLVQGGYRLIARREGETARLVTRRGFDQPLSGRRRCRRQPAGTRGLGSPSKSNVRPATSTKLRRPRWLMKLTN